MEKGFFNTQKKGELYELKVELNGDKKDKKKDAIKRIIAYMTTGKDVSELFPDVVNCMQTDNMELKKLVYLYLMNYAKSHPDMAILAVNTFVKDCDDSNPLIRALAVRTMGCIRVANISEYLCEPLRKCLKDEDPYVRKTAAVCVVKLHSINPDLVEEQGFLASLRDLLGDANPMVISNAVAALAEIVSLSPSAIKYFELNPSTVNKLLTALNECTEWGQIFIMDNLGSYVPNGQIEAQSICERVTSRLSHANAALILSTIKLLLLYTTYLNADNLFISALYKKMGPPLITLLSCEPEIQYVALRNINLITQKYPEILANDAKAFFVKYNDPIYVKLEKLGIMIRLANEKNIQQILNELKEYASEVDVDFVRRSVSAIGRCALKVESSADKCVTTLLDLIQTKVTYVVQESIIVMRDILRKMPNRYESVIEKLCENLDSLDEPDARGALIWIIGEYAERIDNAGEILASFIDGFFDENTQVQLQILTAVVKLFVKKSAENQKFVQEVLSMVTQHSDNPDIRDRGYVYWRLLSTDAVAARNVILAQKQPISPEADNIDPALLDELLKNLSTLASVYHKSPHTFIQGASGLKKPIFAKAEPSSALEDDALPVLMEDENVKTTAVVGQPADSHNMSKNQTNVNAIDDLLDLNFGTSGNLNDVSYSTTISKPASGQPPQPIDLLSGDFLGLDISRSQKGRPTSVLGSNFGIVQMNSSYTPPQTIWLHAAKGKGLDVAGNFVYGNSGMEACIKLSNNALAPMYGFNIQFNGNYFCACLVEPIVFPASLAPKESSVVSIPVRFTGSFIQGNPLDSIQVAMRNNVDVFYFTCTFPIHFYFSDASSSHLDEATHSSKWNELSEQFHAFPADTLIKLPNISEDQIKTKLSNNRIYALSTESTPGTVLGSCVLMNKHYALIKISRTSIPDEWKVAVKSNPMEIASIIQTTLENILKN